MKKRLLMLLLAFSMVAGMTACGSEGGSDSDKKESDKSDDKGDKDESDNKEDGEKSSGDSDEADGLITLGEFEGQPIKWDILEQDDETMLLISHSILTNRVYTDGYSAPYTNWEQSDIRAWLNGEFYDTCFTDDEKARIQTVTLTNEGTEEFWKTYYPQAYFEENPNPCGNTEDKVYLLSINELIQYYGSLETGDDTMIYSYKAIATDLSGGEAIWILRSAGQDGYSYINVMHTGMVCGYYVNSPNGIRPVIRVSR